MAYDVLDPSDLITCLAGADLSTKQYYFVNIYNKAGVAKIEVAATAGGRVNGILQDKPNADGVDALVAGSGISKVVAAGPANPGDLGTCTSTGKAATASATAYQRVGKFLETAAVDGDIVAFKLGNYGPNVP